MRKLIFVAVAALCFFQMLQAYAEEPGSVCALLSAEQASELLGQPVGRGLSQQPRQDPASGGRMNVCTYRGNRAAVILSVVEFNSDSAAGSQLTSSLVEDRMDAGATQITENRNGGAKTYYGVSGNGSIVAFQLGNKVVGLAVGGKAAPSEAALRNTAQLVAGKL